MGWAVIGHTKPYHPEGDPTRTTDEFVFWVYGTQQEASRKKAGLLLFHRLDRRISVREVEEEPWLTDKWLQKKEKKR